MKKIKLAKGRFVLVDNEDLIWLEQGCWMYSSGGYVAGWIWNGKKVVPAQMHRLILKTPKNKIVDHIDGNKLNNQKSNLRLATRSQNQYNRKLSINNKSGVKGVSWYKEKMRWVPEIRANNKSIKLGYFKNLNDAITKRKQAEIQYHGEFRHE